MDQRTLSLTSHDYRARSETESLPNHGPQVARAAAHTFIDITSNRNSYHVYYRIIIKHRRGAVRRCVVCARRATVRSPVAGVLGCGRFWTVSHETARIPSGRRQKMSALSDGQLSQTKFYDIFKIKFKLGVF
jgi:hypothetical protein